MITKIQKWGNSLALRIPKAFADSVGLGNGTEVELFMEDEKLVIVRSLASHSDLEDLLSHVTPENVHEEIDFGEPVGREAW
jgi:antitoxin MazE